LKSHELVGNEESGGNLKVRVFRFPRTPKSNPLPAQCVNLSRYIAQPHHHHQHQELKDLLHHQGCKTNVIDLVSCHFHVSFSKLPKLQKTQNPGRRKSGKCWWQIDVPAEKNEKGKLCAKVKKWNMRECKKQRNFPLNGSGSCGKS